MADSSLAAIETKVRRLTRTPSENQLSTAQINEYINTFILYDMPEHLRLFALKSTFTFYSKPNVDTYATNTASGDTNDPLYNFDNLYISIQQPVYIAGYNVQYSQSRASFYASYPFLNNISSIGASGDNITAQFSGTISSTPILQNNVLFSSIDANNQSLAMIDVPVLDATTGTPTQVGVLVPYNASQAGLPLRNVPVYNDPVANPQFVPYVNNQINYLTGAYTVTFPSAPGNTQPINSQTVPYVASRPQAILYYDNTFVLRPVPDQAYRIDMQVFQQPMQLLASTDQPQLSQWWKYIAYGAAKQFFEDYDDAESVERILPEYEMQKREVLRTTLMQYANQRSSTIYSGQTDNTSSWQGYGSFFGWSNF
jgi:hypothetical protein